MKNLLAVILLALCALVVTSNIGKAQDDDAAPIFVVEVHGEYGLGLISGANVKIFDSGNNIVLEGTTAANGIVAWHVAPMPVGYYRIHLDSWSSHGGSDKTVYYTFTSYFFETINIGPAL